MNIDNAFAVLPIPDCELNTLECLRVSSITNLPLLPPQSLVYRVLSGIVESSRP